MIENIFLDLQPTYIPFVVQCSKTDGTKVDPTASSLIVYEEDGGDGSFSSTQISGSPFSPSKVNAKTGYYGTMIDKSKFTEGKFYLFLWELTVDGRTTAYQEMYYMCDTESFRTTSGGAYPKTYTVLDSNGNPISGVSIRATSDEAGDNLIAVGKSVSDENGKVVIYLPLGTVYIWRYHRNYSFDDPDEELVEA